MSRIINTKPTKEERAYCKSLIASFVGDVENILANDKEFISNDDIKDLTEAKKLFSQKSWWLSVSRIKECFKAEESLRHIARKIWQNTKFDINKMFTLVHAFGFHGTKEAVGQRHLACSLLSANTPQIFGGKYANAGFIVEPNDGFIAAANGDTVAFETPTKAMQRDMGAPSLNPMCLLLCDGETKIYHGDPNTIAWLGNRVCSKLKTPSRLMTDPTRWPDNYNEVVMDNSKLKRTAVFVTENHYSKPISREDNNFKRAEQVSKETNLPFVKIDVDECKVEWIY